MNLIQYIIAGATLGLVAGISPGPVLALVIRESLQNGRKAGMKVATVPFFSDLPVILLSILILTRLTEYNTILGIISFLGAGFILLLAYESIMVKPIQSEIKPQKSTTFWKAVFVNLLSPHPYLFWLLVGSPMAIKAWNIEPMSAILFVASFYICIVGAKLIIAWLSDRSKNVLGTKGYLWVIRILGIILIILAIYLIRDGIIFLKEN